MISMITLAVGVGDGVPIFLEFDGVPTYFTILSKIHCLQQITKQTFIIISKCHGFRGIGIRCR